MSTSNFVDENIVVSEAFIKKFAEMYIKQRSEARFDYHSVGSSSLFESHGFLSSTLERIIIRDSVEIDIKREAGKKPEIVNDIYRSDLGELLLTYYFEEKILPITDRFKLPFKNITNRELAGQPGRGLDAIGYREKNGKIELLIGEAKVSEEKRNPPRIVHQTDDSIYKTQKKFKDDKILLIKRLSDYCRKLSSEDASYIGAVIILIETGKTDYYDILFGCILIRDFSCVKFSADYGKIKSQKADFDPHQLYACVFSFDKEINVTTDLFYRKVQELCVSP